MDPNTYSAIFEGVYESNPSAPGSVYLDSSGLGRYLHDLGLYNATSAPSLFQDTLISKAFSQSLHPTRIIPYFYRASGVFEQDDVTITTLVTSNRFRILKQLVERYRGAYLLYSSLFLRH